MTRSERRREGLCEMGVSPEVASCFQQASRILESKDGNGKWDPVVGMKMTMMILLSTSQKHFKFKT